MKNMKVVKVLRNMQSAFDHGKYTLSYTPHIWTYPLAGKIYGFIDYHHAMKWASDYPGDTLWEAEAELYWNGNCKMYVEEGYFFTDFWEWYLLSLKGYVLPQPPCISIANAPGGTVLCSRLKVTKIIRDL